MEVLETFLKLSESERQKILLLLTNANTNDPSKDSAGTSATDLKDSLNLSGNIPEKPASKQKTLDSWIVKNKTTPSNCEKEVTNSKEIVPIAEKGEAPRSFDLKEVSSTLQDHQLPYDSSTSIEKSSKSENVNKKLMVLLNRQDCLESKHKSPEHSEFSFEKTSISSVAIKSPSEKSAHVSENSDKRIASPEKHSPTPPRSYNLRSARGVPDEKPSSELSNSLVIPSENEDGDKIHRSVAKQKPKVKASAGKDASPNTSTCLKELKNDQKTDSCTNLISKENDENSESKTPSTVDNSELEKTLSSVSVNNIKIIMTDENPTTSELEVTSVMKGKRKRTSKVKESKKLCVANTAQKCSPEKKKVNSKNAEFIPSKKVIKLNENLSELPIEKTVVELPRTDENISANQKQISTNDTDKSVPKLKLKKGVKRKEKNDLISNDKIKLDSTPTKIKKKSLPNPEISKNAVFQNEISDKQLESAATSESQSKECAKKNEEFTKVENSVTLVNANSKKISRKRGSKNKSMKPVKMSLLPDSEMTSKGNEEDSVSDGSTEISSKIFPSQNKESTEEIEELLTKDRDTGTLVNVDSKRISRKRGNENKNMKAAKKIVLSDSELVSKNKDGRTSSKTASKISPSQNNKFTQETEEFLIKDANTVIPMNISSKKKIKKTGGENKNAIAAKNSLSSDLEQISKNDEKHSVDSSKNSPSPTKECSKETEELLIKDTNTATSANVGLKRTSRKRGTGNKSVVTTKNSLISDSEQLSKSSDKDRIISIETISKVSPSQSEFAKETEQLIKDANTVNTLNVSSKKKFRKTGNETKNKVAVKNTLMPDARKASKNVEDGIASTEISGTDSSKNSQSQSKEHSKEVKELLIKDTNSSTSVNVGSKRTNRKRAAGIKCVVTTENSLVSNSEQTFKNSDKDYITSIETDSSRNSPSVVKEFSTKQLSSKNISANEKITLSLNQCSQSVSESDDHSKKISLNSSNDELDSLNKTKELPDNQSQKSSTVLLTLNKSNNSNALPHQRNSNLSGVSKKVNALKKKMNVPANSRKKEKVTKDENQSSTSQSISEIVDIEMKNPDLNLKKNVSKKKIPSSKLKVRDSSEEHSDVPITKSKVSNSNSNLIQEPKNQLLKNLKDQKETARVKDFKKVKESHSKKKINSLESQVDPTNLSQNDEVEKLNSNLIGECFGKNKLCKTKINKNISNKSTNKEKSIKDVESDSSPEKIMESEHLSKRFSDVHMELDSFHSEEKSETCDNSTNSDNSVDAEKAQEMSMDIHDGSESEKVEDDIIRDMEEIAGKEADLADNISNDTDVVQADFENSVEFDEKMNYLAFCKIKEVLKPLGISIEEFFENPDIINSLNSTPSDGAIKINKCKLDSKICICVHESKKETNTLNRLKK